VGGVYSYNEPYSDEVRRVNQYRLGWVTLRQGTAAVPLPNTLHIKHRAANRNDFYLAVNVAIFAVNFPDGIVYFDFALAVFYRLVQAKDPADVLIAPLIQQWMVCCDGMFFAVKLPGGDGGYRQNGKNKYLQIDADYRYQ